MGFFETWQIPAGVRFLAQGHTVKGASAMQTHCQAPLRFRPNAELKPLSEMERAACKAELQVIKEKKGWEETDRGVTVKEGACDPEGKPTEWRFGHAPDYTLANLEYFKYTSRTRGNTITLEAWIRLSRIWSKRGHLSAATRSTSTSKDQAKCIRNPAKLDYDTQKDQMEIGNEDRFSPRVKMHRKSSNMDSGPQPWMQIKQSRAVGRPRKRWEDDINQFFKPEETEETKETILRTTTHGYG